MRKIKLETFFREIQDYESIYNLHFVRTPDSDNIRYTVHTYTGSFVASIDLGCKESDIQPYADLKNPILFYRSQLHDIVEIDNDRENLHDAWWNVRRVWGILEDLSQRSCEKLNEFKEKVKNGKIS